MKERIKKVVALIDYENILISAPINRVLDLKKLHEVILGFGEVIFAFAFMPNHLIYSLPDDIEAIGYTIVACPKAKARSLNDDHKMEDTADINIFSCGVQTLEFPGITDIVIVTDDEHQKNLVSKLRNRGKKIHLIGTKKIAKSLVRVVDSRNIHEVPYK